MQRKIILIITAVLILIVTILAIVGKKDNNEEVIIPKNENNNEIVQVLSDGTKLNVSKKLNETKNVNGFEISNIQFTTNSKGVCVLLANVKNNTGKDTGIKFLDITFLNKEGKTIKKIEGCPVDPMKNGETVQLNSAVSADYSNAYDFKVEIN